MSLQLRLLPSYDKVASFALDVLLVDCGIFPIWYEGERLPELISRFASRDVPTEFSCPFARTHDGEHDAYGQVSEDAYGNPLKWVAARDLATLAAHPLVRCFPRNAAAFAYVAVLPEWWPVVLYWY